MTARTLPAKKKETKGFRGVIRELMMNKHLYLMIQPQIGQYVSNVEIV